jgi:putative transposase
MGHPKRPVGEIPIVFLSSTTHLRKPIFRDSQCSLLFIDILKRYEARGIFRIHTYCVMPDHYHILIELARGVTIRMVLQRIHSRFVWEHFSGRDNLKTRIWSRKTWDVWIRSEWMYWQKVAYILLNPWRAQLVRNPLDPYPYSSIDFYRENYGDEFLLDLFGTYARWGDGLQHRRKFGE